MKAKSVMGVSMICVLGFFLLSGCNFFGRLFNPDLPFDIAGDRIKALTSRGPGGISEFPFTEFSKYQIKVYYVHAWLYDPEIRGHSRHTLLNLPPGDGIAVDLANETLEEVLGSTLIIDNPAGNAVYRLLIGIDPKRVVRGYVYNVGGTGET